MHPANAQELVWSTAESSWIRGKFYNVFSLNKITEVVALVFHLTHSYLQFRLQLGRYLVRIAHLANAIMYPKTVNMSNELFTTSRYQTFVASRFWIHANNA